MLSDWYLRALQSGSWQLALYQDDEEVDAAGYQPQPVDRWDIDGTRARANLTFGPFKTPARFNRSVLHDGNQPVQEMRFDQVTVSSGMVYEQQVTLRVSDG